MADDFEIVDVSDIHTALNAVMGHVGYVQKKRGRGNLGYTFAGEVSILQAVRPVLVAYGIHVYVSDITTLVNDSYTTKSGAVMMYTSFIATVRFHHAPSNTYIDVFAVGKAADSGDKDGNKAMTAALKYALRQTLLLETGDDPDETASVPVVPKALSPKDVSLKDFIANMAPKLPKLAALNVIKSEKDWGPVIKAVLQDANILKSSDKWKAVDIPKAKKALLAAEKKLYS